MQSVVVKAALTVKGSNMNLKDKLKLLEGYAGHPSITKTTQYTGLTGEPDSKVENSSDYGLYYDSKGKLTAGYGDLVESLEEAEDKRNLSEEQASADLDVHIEEKKDLLKSLVPNVEQLSPRLQNALLVETFRGSVPDSTETIKLLNKGKFKEASAEFLNNAEYENQNTSSGIKSRMKEVSDAMKQENIDVGERQQDSFNQKANEAVEMEKRQSNIPVSPMATLRQSMQPKEEEAKRESLKKMSIAKDIDFGIYS